MKWFSKLFERWKNRNRKIIMHGTRGEPIYEDLSDIAKGIIHSIENGEWTETKDQYDYDHWMIEHPSGTVIVCHLNYFRHPDDIYDLTMTCDVGVIEKISENDKNAIAAIIYRNSFGTLKDRLKHYGDKNDKIRKVKNQIIAQAQEFKNKGRLLVLKNEIK